MPNGRMLFATLAMTTVSVAALATAAAITVSQKGRAFDVGNLQIARGQTLHFNNNDQFLHQIYVEAPFFGFESDEQEPGTSVDLQFTKSGLFEVRCHIHPKMLLQVDVH